MFENTKNWLIAEISVIVIYQDPAPIPGSSVVTLAKAFIDDIKIIIKKL